MRKGLALLATVALLGVAACGDDDEDGGGSGQAQTLSASLDAQGKLQGIEDIDEGGAVKLDFENDSKLPYDVQLVQVDGDQTVDQVLKVIDSEGGPIPSWIHGAGGVGSTKPGASSSSTQVLGPGTYYAIASAESEDEGPKPATASFEVKGGQAAGELPAAPGLVTAREYEFEARGLKPGKNTIGFVNEGKELHHVVAFQLKPGKTAADLKTAFEDEEGGGPPPFVEGTDTSTAVIDGGIQQVTELELAGPGKYALVCFIQDRKGGPPHVAKGMITEVDVQ